MARGRSSGPRRAAAAVLATIGALAVLTGRAPTVHASSTVHVTDTGSASWMGEGNFAGGAYVTTDQGAQCFDSSGHPRATALHGPGACEVDTLYADMPPGFWASHGGGVEVKTTEAQTDDFDLYVYRRNSDGTRGAFVGSSGLGAGQGEDLVIQEATGGYYVVMVAFTTVGNYTATAHFVPAPLIPKSPPVATNPPGLRSYRASHDQFISHSEPNIAMNPLNHANLVAGSKQYVNLQHYLFRIGMYYSFDGGQTWGDTGHLPVPSPAVTPTRCQGNPTNGSCQFVTSDIWTTFDDEGNAYAIVLVSPDASGTGWEMWMYKSTNGGVSWSGPVVIHDHIHHLLSPLFLDDKDAIAVDNYTQAGAGPIFAPNKPHDGHVGNLYACWELDGSQAPTQDLAFTRSMDGGQTWQQGLVTIVSGLTNQFEIGCQISVAPSGRVYVAFLVSGVLAGPSTGLPNYGIGQYLTWSDSHGDPGSFVPPIKIADVNLIPNHLQPSDRFRNLSLPAMAVAPKDGTVYVTWADEHMQGTGKNAVNDADILMIKGTDNGLGGPPTFGAPVRVNQDPAGDGKDQFQPQIAVTESGQVDISYFDRRNDPSNFFIDTYLSRSNDGGAHWTDTRVTRAMSDPRINPPIDSGGNAFYGDYQGLVADDTCAIPFWNGTHLANLPTSDPHYSPWQEVFSARVPNGGASCPGSSPAAGVAAAPSAAPPQNPSTMPTLPNTSTAPTPVLPPVGGGALLIAAAQFMRRRRPRSRD